MCLRPQGAWGSLLGERGSAGTAAAHLMIISWCASMDSASWVQTGTDVCMVVQAKSSDKLEIQTGRPEKGFLLLSIQFLMDIKEFLWESPVCNSLSITFWDRIKEFIPHQRNQLDGPGIRIHDVCLIVMYFRVSGTQNHPKSARFVCRNGDFPKECQ